MLSPAHLRSAHATPTLPLPLLQELDAIKLRYENSGYVFTKLTPKAHATP